MKRQNWLIMNTFNRNIHKKQTKKSSVTNASIQINYPHVWKILLITSLYLSEKLNYWNTVSVMEVHEVLFKFLAPAGKAVSLDLCACVSIWN